jgi:hypothetical protein
MQVEAKIIVPTGPEPIFQLYSDVKNWHLWDPDTKSAFIEGDFQVGNKGRLTPTKGSSVPMELTSLEANKSFTVESKVPFFKMVFEHQLKVVVGGTEVTHRVVFSGLLAPLLGRLLAKQLRSSLPKTLQSLSLHALRNGSR